MSAERIGEWEKREDGAWHALSAEAEWEYGKLWVWAEDGSGGARLPPALLAHFLREQGWECNPPEEKP